MTFLGCLQSSQLVLGLSEVSRVDLHWDRGVWDKEESCVFRAIRNQFHGE